MIILSHYYLLLKPKSCNDNRYNSTYLQNKLPIRYLDLAPLSKILNGKYTEVVPAKDD